MYKKILILLCVVLISLLSISPVSADMGFKGKEFLPSGLQLKLEQGKELPKPFLSNCIVDEQPQVIPELSYNLTLSKETLVVNDIITFLLTVENNTEQIVAKEYNGKNYAIIVEEITNCPEGQIVWQYYGPDVTSLSFEPGFSTLYYGGTFKPISPGIYSVTAYFMDELAAEAIFHVE